MKKVEEKEKEKVVVAVREMEATKIALARSRGETKRLRHELMATKQQELELREVVRERDAMVSELRATLQVNRYIYIYHILCTPIHPHPDDLHPDDLPP